MRGARARIGLIVPSKNVVMETDFWRMVPEGVTIHLGARSVAILTPYVREINDRVRAFVEANGLTVSRLVGMEIRTTGEIAAAAPAEVERWARDADSPDADALFIACTQLRGWEAVSPLEGELGKPVVTSNQASLWAALRRLGCHDRIDGAGRLLAG